MNDKEITVQELEERYKKVVVRTEETIDPFSGKKRKKNPRRFDSRWNHVLRAYRIFAFWHNVQRRHGVLHVPTRLWHRYF